MSYTALYRKWRPPSFSDVKGQDHIVQTLKNQIVSGRIGHAYLFCGTRGTGKTSIAKIFAKAVNCEHPADGSPCGECQTCKNIAAGASLNVVEIDAASNNGVENIREIRDEVQYPPTEGKYRVYIIDEVHMLSTGAFNALLKTLEEPPSYIIFILATTEVQKIPVTVLSRCQRYDFKRITVEIIVEHLKELTAAEHIQVEDRALTYIAKAADGALRDALSLLDQCIAFHYGELLTYDNVLDVLGAVDITVFGTMFRAIVENRTKDCITSLEELVIQGRELGQFVIDFIWYLRNLLILKSVDNAENLLDMSTENQNLLKEDSKLTDNETLLRYIRVFSDLSNQLRYAFQKRVLIEVALIKLTRPQMEQNLDSILQRISNIEKQLESGIVVNTSPDTLNAGEGNGGSNAAVPELTPAERVALPKGQLEDLNLIRSEWGKIIRELGGPIRASFRDTVVEPAGESCLCVVFSDQSNYMIGSRDTTVAAIERYVEDHYQKSITFKTRLLGGGERLDTVYVSDEELKANILMDITIED
ncbi:DNA polymerase III subunit gamma/tau [Lacrimispora sphenoides]|uniref:DNA-directed DNA polymerase n=1 Tax=Lacrimispora sphenoides JCM 1415 TaxID=1297793 RepID=A0ABY1CHS6_9FIRM|nr:DNA polymerase III subunit gamma/tau [Lacrimispora sphenoides]SEU03460.1 DNA polymerase-3 subunit gamma/tau [[Clostridium] sphenoides JCM 1415]SUY48781.1 DNA polymerase III subunits gamma and tau [Lacrimispora sphenoides]